MLDRQRRQRPSASIMLLALFGIGSLMWGLSSSFAGEPAAKAETDYISAGDVRYAYRRFGEGDDVPLVLITRYRANMDDWDPAFLDALAAKRQVIIFNQSGIASSSGTVPPTIEGMAADVARFVEALGHDEVDVLGWSMGGFTAQAMLIDHPAIVRRAILIGTGPAASTRTPAPKEGVFDTATKAARDDGLTTYSDDDRHYLFFADHPLSRKLATLSLQRIDQVRRDDEPVTTPAVMEAQTAAIQHWWFDVQNGYFDRLGEITEPVLIINGDRDAFFTVEAQNVLFEEIPNSQLTILPAAGHGPQHQHPNDIADLISRFLD